MKLATDMFDRYWTMGTAAICLLVAAGVGRADTECNLHEFKRLSTHQGKKIDKGIRHSGTAESLLKCLSVCNRVGISNVFYSPDTKDCICPLSHPPAWFLVDGPGYVYFNSPGVIQRLILDVMNVSSEQAGYPATNAIGNTADRWKPRLDDTEPWIEFGVRLSLYVEELQIREVTSAKGIWFRDGNGSWIKTWTTGDDYSRLGDWFYPNFQMLTVRTDAIRLSLNNPSGGQIYYIYVLGRV